MKNEFKTLEFSDGYFTFIDQTCLPLNEKFVRTDKVEIIARGIERLEIRGAPAIGVAAAYALALSLKGLQPGNTTETAENIFLTAFNRLASTRPTAVNLFYALDKVKERFYELMENNLSVQELYPALIDVARQIHKDDAEKCRRISEAGLGLFTKPSCVLTHCNAGSLATAGIGTALGIIKLAFEKGFVSYVYSDETRPLFQGSRLTAFELSKSGIPFSINTDNSAAWLMANGKIDMVITGADRIASNGDSANKIGTYNLAVLCRHHKIPFYIAAPTSTIDKNCKSGKDIVVEERNKKEVICYKELPITRDDYNVYSPAFDVTPSSLIDAIITEDGIFRLPYEF